MKVDPFDQPAAANNIAEQPDKTFTCIKCREEVGYSEFFKHDDPTFDYGFYVWSGDVHAVGVEIIKGIDLCEYCVPNMYRNEEKKNG